MEQGNLFDFKNKTGKPTIEDRFLSFDAANPHIFSRLKIIALNLRRSGRKKYGVKALFERLRWDGDVMTDAEDEYKLSNDFTALYARKLMREVPELRGFFSVRPRREPRRSSGTR